MASTISSACDLSSPYKIAVQSSTAIYGANVLLGTSCLYLLVSSTLLRKDQLTKVVALCLYVSAMLGFASQTIVHVSQIMLGEASGIPGQLPYLPPGTTIWGVVQFSAMSLPFVILGTNGFMVYSMTTRSGLSPRSNSFVVPRCGDASCCIKGSVHPSVL